MTHNIDPLLQRLLSQHLPAASAAGNFLPLDGLTGLSGKVQWGSHRLLARRQPLQPLPLVSRQREYRLLRKLSVSGLVAPPLACSPQWLLLPWLKGDSVTQPLATHRAALLALLNQLHHQPLTGYRLSVLPLLERYWQLCHQRHHRWQRALRRLQRQGEPVPLRLAPLHMDIHAGNLLHTVNGLRLIDWEYAADGDIALELANLCTDVTDAGQWLSEYAAIAGLSSATLQRQVARWQPWLALLSASWFQLRAEQSGEPHLIAAAREAWHKLN